MAHNRTSQYSAPYKRNTFLSLNQYAAAANFPTIGTWDRARMNDLYVMKGTVGRSQPVCIIVVGAITSDKTELQSHGNYNPKYMTEIDQIGKKAKLQFLISSPASEPEFESDYQTALERLRAIQDEVAGSVSKKEHFLDRDSIKLNFQLFEPKDPEELEDQVSEDEEGEITSDVERSVSEEEVEDKPEVTKAQPYEVTSAYQSTWNAVGRLYHNKIMQVYGPDENLIDYRTFSKHLISGTIVAVSFTLTHYPVRGSGTKLIESDTYTANIQSVSILKPGEKRPRIAFRDIPNRRPLPVSQIPRRTLKLAADTFAPIRTSRPASRSPSPPRMTSVRRTTSVFRGRGLFKGKRTKSHEVGDEPQFVEGCSGRQSFESDTEPSMTMTPALLARILPLFLEQMNNQSSPTPESTISATDSASSPAISTESTLSTEGDTPERASDQEGAACVETPASGSVSSQDHPQAVYDQLEQLNREHPAAAESVPTDSSDIAVLDIEAAASETMSTLPAMNPVSARRETKRRKL